MNTHKSCFHREVRKILILYTLLKLEFFLFVFFVIVNPKFPKIKISITSH